MYVELLRKNIHIKLTSGLFMRLLIFKFCWKFFGIFQSKFYFLYERIKEWESEKPS